MQVRRSLSHSKRPLRSARHSPRLPTHQVMKIKLIVLGVLLIVTLSLAGCFDGGRDYGGYGYPAYGYGYGGYREGRFFGERFHGFHDGFHGDRFYGGGFHSGRFHSGGFHCGGVF